MPLWGKRVPPEVDAIFKRLANFLESEDEQNIGLPGPFRSLVVSGINCDEVPRAVGEFGRAPSNPIPANGPFGQIIYLSHLRTAAGSPVMFHRVRAEDGPAGAVDVYEVL